MSSISYFFGAILLFGSIVGLVVWIDSVLKLNRDQSTLTFARQSILIFAVYEFILAFCAVGYYFTYQPDGFNTGFLWANLVLYGRGALPALIATPIEDNPSDVAIAVLAAFILHVLVDISLLYMSFYIRKLWRRFSPRKE